MIDQRFRRWLQVTETALAAPESERAEAFMAACREREQLCHSLLENPPVDDIDIETSERLARAEACLIEAATTEHGRLGEQVRSIREQKVSTQAYRPARMRNPVFVSRKA